MANTNCCCFLNNEINVIKYLAKIKNFIYDEGTAHPNISIIELESIKDCIRISKIDYKLFSIIVDRKGNFPIYKENIQLCDVVITLLTI